MFEQHFDNGIAITGSLRLPNDLQLKIVLLNNRFSILSLNSYSNVAVSIVAFTVSELCC